MRNDTLLDAERFENVFPSFEVKVKYCLMLTYVLVLDFILCTWYASIYRILVMQMLNISGLTYVS